MTQKALKEVMERLYNLQDQERDEDETSYEEVFHAVDVLVNVGLLPAALKNAMIDFDHELFMTE